MLVQKPSAPVTSLQIRSSVVPRGPDPNGTWQPQAEMHKGGVCPRSRRLALNESRGCNVSLQKVLMENVNYQRRGGRVKAPQWGQRGWWLDRR